MNDRDELNDEGWKRLVKSLTSTSNKCVLVLGPDIVSESNGKTSLVDELAGQLIHRFGLIEVNARDDLYHIMQRFFDQGGRRFELEDFLFDFYEQPRPIPRLYEQLATLPFETYLTITHDKYLQSALKNLSEKTPQFGYYNYRKKVSANFREPNADHPLVYQLFGSLEQTESLILGENDLLMFLQHVVTGTPDLAEQIQGVLRDERTSFLFLGFGFSQWYVRILLHALLGPNRYVHRQNQRPSIVMECPKFFAHPDSRRAIAYFNGQHTFRFYLCSEKNVTPSGFVEELVRRYRERRDAAPDSSMSFSEDSPTVFFSYRRSDEKKVSQLRDTLQSAGIRVWQDMCNLRGGDNWEQALQRVINKEADRFVLLQTPALVSAERSIVWKELRQAEERDKETIPDKISRFIIPVILEPCDPITSLGKYHHIDLTKSDGTDALIKAILGDPDIG